MRPVSFLRPLIVVALAVGAALSPRAAAADAGPLALASAELRFDVNPRTGAPRDRLSLRGRFPDPAAIRSFDPAADGIRVTVGGIDVLDAAPPLAPPVYRAWRKRGAVVRWRWRGKSGATVRRWDAVARHGDFRLVVDRADLHALRDAGPDAVTVTVTLGAASATATVPFQVKRASSPTIWRWRNLPPTPGPLTFTSLAAGTLSNVPRPEWEIARDASAFDAIWTALGSPGPSPVVDFAQEMVVVVSANVPGPGMFPPFLHPVTVADTGAGLRVQWRLQLCEEPNQCPGAPVDCPFATPYHVFRVRQTPGDATLEQVESVWACP